MEACISRKYPSIKAFERRFKQEKVEKAIMILVADLNKSFKGSLDKEEIEELAVEINVNHFQLSFEDLYTVFQQIKHDKASYAGISINHVLNKIKQYKQQRIDKAAELSLNQHLSGHHQTGFERLMDDPLFKEGKTKQLIKNINHINKLNHGKIGTKRKTQPKD